MLTPELIQALRALDTPTICNALEIAMGGRVAHGFTYGTLIAAPKPLPAVVGIARTARIRASTPSRLDAATMRGTRLAYYRHVAGHPLGPVIVVMQDMDDRPGTGSFWGEVNSAVHEGLGVGGVLTNGSVRDIGDLSPTFPILAGSVGPSHAHVHIVDFGQPVEVFGLQVNDGDLIHADRHGAVIIAPQYLAQMPECIDLVRRKEAPLLEAARSGRFDLGMLEEAMLHADEIH